MQDLRTICRTAGTVLSDLAASGGHVNYSPLASRLGLPPMTANWQKHPLSAVFAVLDAEDVALGRPLRTASVINKATARPGSGFYRGLARRRNIELRADRGARKRLPGRAPGRTRSLRR